MRKGPESGISRPKKLISHLNYLTNFKKSPEKCLSLLCFYREKSEAFIRTHQHVPEVPSAAEVAADGIDLGEMNQQLLKKPEEMTLHMIGMKKQIKALEARLPQQ
ncbi:hypothetical protein ACTJJB_17945 [Chitinophaga sp. 22536]|uniref:hypothetical protein n=1 Tax=unclassified Chitinophaga TaxID=2619133 RepID=UPI003F83956B